MDRLVEPVDRLAEQAIEFDAVPRCSLICRPAPMPSTMRHVGDVQWMVARHGWRGPPDDGSTSVTRQTGTIRSVAVAMAQR